LDIANAFNSLPWGRVVGALRGHFLLNVCILKNDLFNVGVYHDDDEVVGPMLHDNLIDLGNDKRIEITNLTNKIQRKCKIHISEMYINKNKICTNK
ncbi:hypothetical protein ALC57_00395, partial [Trachymyrmex cornetzi]